MYRSGKVFLPSLGHFFRALVVAIFLIGMLPVPALAADNGLLAGQVTDNTSTPISGVTILVFSANASWPTAISYATTNITPSANTGLGKQEVTFTASANATPGTWTFRVTGTSGNLTHNTDVMVIGTPSGTTVTSFASPLLDPTTVTPSTPINMTLPSGESITIQGIINEGAEASTITIALIYWRTRARA